MTSPANEARPENLEEIYLDDEGFKDLITVEAIKLYKYVSTNHERGGPYDFEIIARHLCALDIYLGKYQKLRSGGGISIHRTSGVEQ